MHVMSAGKLILRPLSALSLVVALVGVLTVALAGVFAFGGAPALATTPISPTVTIKPVGTVTSSTVKVSGTVNPNATPTTTAWNFQYSKDPTTEGWTVSPVSGVLAAGVNVAEEVTGTIEGLQPDASYQVRLVASNEEGGEGISAEPNPAFKTPVAAPLIGEGSESTTRVSPDSAQLNAEVNPGDGSTSYYFEYGTSGSYESRTATAVLPAVDDTLHAVSATIEGLAADTEYHYRIVAHNEAGTVPGTGSAFTTQPATGPLVLPDHRQWELVSPPEKDGASVDGIIAENGVLPGGSGAVQAAEDGSGITYLTTAPVGPGEPAGSVFGSQILSSRVAAPGGGEEWASQDISPANTNWQTVSLNYGEPYRAFSHDLSQGALQEDGATGTPVEHFDATVNLDAGESGLFDELPGGGLPFPVDFQAATPDLRHLVVGASEEGSAELYEWPGPGEGLSGSPVQVNILPKSTDPSIPAFLGGFNQGTLAEPSEFAGRYAVSADGNRVVWGNGEDLFTRDLVTGETSQVDAALGGGGVFQLANSAGTRVFFTKGVLYLYNVMSERLSELTPGAGVTDVLGANKEGTIVYVTSVNALTKEANAQGEEAVEGKPNIFMLREVSEGVWSTSFVASLSEGDEAGYNRPNEGVPGLLAHWPVRVSGNGEFLAFMSNRSLTGYDNRDAVSGEADEEVFLYGARAGSLVCASCDPSGARPLGELDTGAYPGLPMDPARTWGRFGEGTSEHWVASVIPGWNEALNPGDKHIDSPLYASRVLSDSGRLFFDSSDALVPQDVNRREDVYEYEPGGEGSCPSGQAGCVALISSGQGDDDSDFVDASTSGDDVFFTTADRLVPADKDETVDMYDASVCGTEGTHSCFPESSVVAPPCTTADSCRAAQAVQPGVFGPSGSATFSGSGNLRPLPAPTPAKPKPLSRAQKLAKALRACRKKPRSKRSRISCEKQARKRYGVSDAKKSNLDRGAGR
jgi:hypothetical protein